MNNKDLEKAYEIAKICQCDDPIISNKNGDIVLYMSAVDSDCENYFDLYNIEQIKLNDKPYNIVNVSAATTKEDMNNYIVTNEVLERDVENLGKTLEEANEVMEEIRDIVEWLSIHNKNYTKEQYNKILDLQDLINNL